MLKKDACHSHVRMSDVILKILYLDRDQRILTTEIIIQDVAEKGAGVWMCCNIPWWMRQRQMSIVRCHTTCPGIVLTARRQTSVLLRDVSKHRVKTQQSRDNKNTQLEIDIRPGSNSVCTVSDVNIWILADTNSSILVWYRCIPNIHRINEKRQFNFKIHTS